MSQLAASNLLEQKLRDVCGGTYPTAWENTPFTPKAGTAWQAVHGLPSQTLNPSYGDDFERLVGTLQVMLVHPKNEGRHNAQERAQMLCDGFKRGTTLIAAGVRVLVDRSPWVGPAMNDGAWYRLPVSIPYIVDVN